MLQVSGLKRIIALLSLGVIFLFPIAKAEEETKPDLPSLIVAGGCFWCVESNFEKTTGVIEAVSGYSGGDLKNATYRNHKGHREVVEIFYDPALTSYETLVDTFMRSTDVVDPGGQFCDRGHEYSTAIHYRTDQEKEIAVAAIEKAAKTLGLTIATQVEPFTFFVTAEDYHQNYYKKNPLRYRLYRTNCGRDRQVKRLWGDKAITH